MHVLLTLHRPRCHGLPSKFHKFMESLPFVARFSPPIPTGKSAFSGKGNLFKVNFDEWPAITLDPVVTLSREPDLDLIETSEDDRDIFAQRFFFENATLSPRCLGESFSFS